MKYIAINDRVAHSVLGDGTVKKIENGPFGKEVSILFDLHGEKTLVWGLASSRITKKSEDKGGEV